MLEAIRQIINAIPRNCIFDTHLIINQLIKNHSDVYLDYAASINAPGGRTLPTHGNIGKLVNQLAGEGLVELLPHEAYSETIHGTIGKCASWRKL